MGSSGGPRGHSVIVGPAMCVDGSIQGSAKCRGWTCGTRARTQGLCMLSTYFSLLACF